MEQFEVIVIGGGHAGTEAACAAARMGARTVLLTHRFDRLGEMSCNPAIGGLGKAHLVREVDALDGLIARIGDQASIQYRLLNRSKGPAVQGPRAQIDRNLYRAAMQNEIASYPNLSVIEGEVECFDIKGGNVVAAVLSNDRHIFGAQFVLTTGTFLGGVIHIGEKQIAAGRVGDPASVTLATQLRELELPMARLKTGTPPRLLSSSIDWDNVGRQYADEQPVYFSFLTNEVHNSQISCGVTETNPQTHQIIEENIHQSAMYSGNISGNGPRYCPSIEDKVVRFSNKDHHQIFLEPEGLDNNLVYPNGISTSLPEEVQKAYVHSIKGLEKAKITQFGYAIEYDYIDPRSLDRGLRLKSFENLFFAGQINGTTGYEEAAAQGLVAGANAVLTMRGEEYLDFNRTNSYIGVLIDDLISRGVTEPYRMFTSRAEYRLSIRCDNADQRLTPIGISSGLVGTDRAKAFSQKMERLADARAYCEGQNLTPNEAQSFGINVKSDGRRRNILDFMSLPNQTVEELIQIFPKLKNIGASDLRQVEIDAIYSKYVDRQALDIAKTERDRLVSIPKSFNYKNVKGLSNELLLKLEASLPENIAEANMIEGMTPAALTLIAAHLRKRGAA